MKIWYKIYSNIRNDLTYKEKKKFVLDKIENKDLFKKVLKKYPFIVKENIKKWVSPVNKSALEEKNFVQSQRKRFIQSILNFYLKHYQILICFERNLPFCLEDDKRKQIKKYLEYIMTLPKGEKGDKIYGKCFFNSTGYFSRRLEPFYIENEFLYKSFRAATDYYEFANNDIERRKKLRKKAQEVLDDFQNYSLDDLNNKLERFTFV